jgi:16S rRNA (cytosine967-C5)-methyltransferase
MPGPDARSVAHAVLLRVETTAAPPICCWPGRSVGCPLRIGRWPPIWCTERSHGRAAGPSLAGLLRGTTVARLDPPVRVALRLGLYQLLFLERVPAYAAVDSSVRLAARARRAAAGLVNACCDGRQRRADPCPCPTRRLPSVVTHGGWSAVRRAVLTDELPALLAAHNVPVEWRARQHGPCDARALAAELEAAGVAVAPTASCPMRWWWNVRWPATGATGIPAGLPTRARPQLVTLLLGLEPGAY